MQAFLFILLSNQGKEEHNNAFVSLIPKYRNKKNTSINNDMSKYVLKDYNNNNNLK